MDAKDATVMAYQLKELKEAARRKSDIMAAVAVHKAAGAKRMVRLFIFSWFFAEGLSLVVFVNCVFDILLSC